jgi:hypothetical protein
MLKYQKEEKLIDHMLSVILKVLNIISIEKPWYSIYIYI